MPFCQNCGKEVSAASNFCMSCGFNLKGAQPAPSAAAPAAAPAAPASAGGERVPCIVAVLKKPKSFGRWDVYNLAVTDRRMLFAQMTNEMLKGAIAEAQLQAKADGKGLLRQVAAQMSAGARYAQRYLVMEPEAILRETQGNFAIDNASVTEIKIKSENDDNRVSYEFKVKTKNGKYEFELDNYPDSVDALKQVFGGRVKASGGGFTIRLRN